MNNKFHDHIKFNFSLRVLKKSVRKKPGHFYKKKKKIVSGTFQETMSGKLTRPFSYDLENNFQIFLMIHISRLYKILFFILFFMFKLILNSKL